MTLPRGMTLLQSWWWRADDEDDCELGAEQLLCPSHLAPKTLSTCRGVSPLRISKLCPGIWKILRRFVWKFGLVSTPAKRPPWELCKKHKSQMHLPLPPSFLPFPLLRESFFNTLCICRHNEVAAMRDPALSSSTSAHFFFKPDASRLKAYIVFPLRIYVLDPSIHSGKHMYRVNYECQNRIFGPQKTERLKWPESVHTSDAKKTVFLL